MDVGGYIYIRGIIWIMEKKFEFFTQEAFKVETCPERWHRGPQNTETIFCFMFHLNVQSLGYWGNVPMYITHLIPEALNPNPTLRASYSSAHMNSRHPTKTLVLSTSFLEGSKIH